MPDVQNIGTTDYSQYQPSQYPAENYTEDYSMQPEVYDENTAQIKAASKSSLGATLLTTGIIAGLALWGGHALGKRSAKDAIANYEKAQKAMEEIEKAAEEGNGKWFGENHCGDKLLAKIKRIFKPFRKAAEDSKDKVKEGTEKAAEETKSAAKELK